MIILDKELDEEIDGGEFLKIERAEWYDTHYHYEREVN